MYYDLLTHSALHTQGVGESSQEVVKIGIEMNVRYNAGMYIENKKRIARRTEEMKRNEANKGEIRAKKKREERLLSRVYQKYLCTQGNHEQGDSLCPYEMIGL